MDKSKDENHKDGKKHRIVQREWQNIFLRQKNLKNQNPYIEGYNKKDQSQLSQKIEIADKWIARGCAKA